MPPRVKETREKPAAKPAAPPRSKAPYRGELACPVCGDVMTHREDLVLEWARAGERVIVPRLTGHRCSACGEQLFDAASSGVIDRHIHAGGPRGGYELRVTGLSKGKVGLYFTGDLVREMRIAKGQGFLAIPLSRDQMLLERVPADA